MADIRKFFLKKDDTRKQDDDGEGATPPSAPRRSYPTPKSKLPTVPYYLQSVCSCPQVAVPLFLGDNILGRTAKMDKTTPNKLLLNVPTTEEGLGRQQAKLRVIQGGDGSYTFRLTNQAVNAIKVTKIVQNGSTKVRMLQTGDKSSVVKGEYITLDGYRKKGNKHVFLLCHGNKPQKREEVRKPRKKKPPVQSSKITSFYDLTESPPETCPSTPKGHTPSVKDIESSIEEDCVLLDGDEHSAEPTISPSDYLTVTKALKKERERMDVTSGVGSNGNSAATRVKHEKAELQDVSEHPHEAMAKSDVSASRCSEPKQSPVGGGREAKLELVQDSQSNEEDGGEGEGEGEVSLDATGATTGFDKLESSTLDLAALISKVEAHNLRPSTLELDNKEMDAKGSEGEAGPLDPSAHKYCPGDLVDFSGIFSPGLRVRPSGVYKVIKVIKDEQEQQWYYSIQSVLGGSKAFKVSIGLISPHDTTPRKRKKQTHNSPSCHKQNNLASAPASASTLASASPEGGSRMVEIEGIEKKEKLLTSFRTKGTKGNDAVPKPGDRIAVLYTDGWYLGTVMSSAPAVTSNLEVSVEVSVLFDSSEEEEKFDYPGTSENPIMLVDDFHAFSQAEAAEPWSQGRDLTHSRGKALLACAPQKLVGLTYEWWSNGCKYVVTITNVDEDGISNRFVFASTRSRLHNWEVEEDAIEETNPHHKVLDWLYTFAQKRKRDYLKAQAHQKDAKDAASSVSDQVLCGVSSCGRAPSLPKHHQNVSMARIKVKAAGKAAGSVKKEKEKDSRGETLSLIGTKGTNGTNGATGPNKRAKKKLQLPMESAPRPRGDSDDYLPKRKRKRTENDVTKASVPTQAEELEKLLIATGKQKEVSYFISRVQNDIQVTATGDEVLLAAYCFRSQMLQSRLMPRHELLSKLKDNMLKATCCGRMETLRVMLELPAAILPGYWEPAVWDDFNCHLQRMSRATDERSHSAYHAHVAVAEVWCTLLEDRVSRRAGFESNTPLVFKGAYSERKAAAAMIQAACNSWAAFGHTVIQDKVNASESHMVYGCKVLARLASVAGEVYFQSDGNRALADIGGLFQNEIERSLEGDDLKMAFLSSLPARRFNPYIAKMLLEVMANKKTTHLHLHPILTLSV
ncbi:unnamed protein product [Chrysoparadoxa australica]